MFNVRTYINYYMSFLRDLEALALGSRVKGLSDALLKDMSTIYKDQGIDFEPRWFTFFQLILHKKEIAITQIATELNQSHPAVVQVVNILEKKQLLTSKKDERDHRRRLVRLTPDGEELAGELQDLWEDVHAAANELLEKNAPGFLDNVAKLEDALAEKSIYQRIKANRVKRLIKGAGFIDFYHDMLPQFKKLNEEWLKEHLEITRHDRKILDDPFNEIIKKGGEIHLVVTGRQVIGTYVLQKLGNASCELSKFTVAKDFRGYSLGKKMLDHAIVQARKMECKTLLLLTHDKLVAATGLYRKKGFEDIDPHPGLADHSGRCSLTMKLDLNHK